MGGEQDLDLLLKKWGEKIFALAFRLSCNRDEAADITQETFVKAIEHWDDFRKEADTGTWLYRICVNTWKNHLRSKQRRSFWHFYWTSEPQADESPLDAGVEIEDQKQKLSAALARLDPQDRAIIVMREIEERSYEEIAAWLDIPLGTVKSRLSRTREKLKQLYGEGDSYE